MLLVEPADGHRRDGGCLDLASAPTMSSSYANGEVVVPPLLSVTETCEPTCTPTRRSEPRLASEDADESLRTASTTPLR
jgi:hypothetical protein